MQRSYAHIGGTLCWRTLFGVFVLTVFSLSAQSLLAQSLTVIPERAGAGPVGVILEGQYTRFDGRSLLGPTLAAETAPQRLARRWAQLTAAKDKEGLMELHFSGDGSKSRFSAGIDRLATFQPEFRLSSATLLEQLQWDGLTVLILALRGNLVGPKTTPLFSICPNAPKCYLVLPQFGPQNRQFESLATVLTLFSKYSTPATSTQLQAFLARNPTVVELKPSTAYASPAGAPVVVKLLVEPYVNVPPTNAAGEPPPAYEKRPELKALFVLLQRLRAMVEGDITDDNDAFRQFMNQEFHADYAADVDYGISRLIDEKYVVDSLSAADFVKAIRSWDSVGPACAVRHGDTVFVFMRAGRGEEPKALQQFPVKVVNNRASFEALRFANYLGGLLQTPEVLTELEKSCKMKRSS